MNSHVKLKKDITLKLITINERSMTAVQVGFPPKKLQAKICGENEKGGAGSTVCRISPSSW